MVLLPHYGGKTASVAQLTFAYLQLVRQLVPYLTSQDLAIVIHAIVTSKLDYFNSLYEGLSLVLEGS